MINFNPHTEWMYDVDIVKTSNKIKTCPLSKIKNFIEQNRYVDPYILICASGDVQINGPIKLPENVKKVYTTNCNVAPGNGFHALPYGMMPFSSKIVQNYNKKLEKDIFVYSNFRTHTHKPRKKIYNIVKNKEFILHEVFTQPGQKDTYEIMEKYFDQIARSKFCICPPGNGIDTYRMWEIIMTGSIPIVLKSHMIQHFKYDLPILDIECYSKLTEKYLEQKYEEMLQKKYEKKLIDINYWKETWENDVNNCTKEYK